MISYFLEVLHSGDKNVLISREQGWIDAWEDEVTPWYSQSLIDLSLTITQGTISMGGLGRDLFWIRQIEAIPNGYRVTVTWNRRDAIQHPNRTRSTNVNLPARDVTPNFDLHFIFDGDYLDVFYSVDDSEKNFSASFALIDPEMRRQINGRIRHSWMTPFEPSRITFWPRRADGTMDFLPPAGSPAAREINAAKAAPEAPAPVAGF